MIQVYYKNESDGSLSLAIIKQSSPIVLCFDSMRFFLKNKTDIDLSTFMPLNLKIRIITLDELRNDEFDLFFLRVNSDVLIQISWIQLNDGMSQQIGVFDKSMTNKIPTLKKTIYEAAEKRFLESDKYEGLEHPFFI